MIIWTEEKPMSKTLIMVDHMTKKSRGLRIYYKQGKFKKIVNKALSIIGMRWL